MVTNYVGSLELLLTLLIKIKRAKDGISYSGAEVHLPSTVGSQHYHFFHFA